MKLLFLWIALTLISCAKTNPEIRPSDELTVFIYATKYSGDQSYCYVALRDPQNGNDFYALEPEAIVTCDGKVTTVDGGGWEAYFTHVGTDPVRVSIVRPSAGSTLIRYGNLE